MSNVVPDRLEDQIVWLAQKVADLERRSRNRKRMGTVTEVDADKGVARVKLSESDDGTEYKTGWIPWKEHSAGKHKTHYPVRVGEQVYVTSENGDLTDAEIDRSMPSDENPRPSKKENEVVLSDVGKHRDNVEDDGDKRTIKVGAASIELTDGKITIKIGSSSIEMTNGEMILKSPSIKENP